MNTETPTPRLVPDRPSDAAIAQAFWIWRTYQPAAVDAVMAKIEDHAREIDAAAPPAEAPGEVERVALAIANVVGHGMAEKCEAQARAAILAMAAAPAGECGWAPLRGDDADTLPQYPMTTHPNERVSMTYAQYLTLRGAAPAAPATDDWFGDVLASAGTVEPLTTLTTPRVTGGREELAALYAAASKGFHVSETCGPDGKYLHVSKFRNMADLHAYEDAWRGAIMAAARDALQAANGGEG